MPQLQRKSLNTALKERNFNGTLRGELHLALLTGRAELPMRVQMVRDNPMITGLLSFADLLRLVWQAASEGESLRRLNLCTTI